MNVKPYSPLEGSQEDINRRFLHMIEEAESGNSAAIKALQDEIGDATTANTILKRLKDIEDAIGDESDATSILGRIKALETG